MSIPGKRVEELSNFVELLKKDPTILQKKEFSFFKEYLSSLGANLPDEGTKTEEDFQEGNRNDTASTTKEDEDVEADEENEQDEEDAVLEEEFADDPAIIAPESEPLPPRAPVRESELSDAEYDKIAVLKANAAEHTAKEEYLKALEYYNEIIAIGNPSAMLHTRRADILFKLKRPMACIADCNDATVLNPDNATAHKLRGVAYRYLGKYKEAREDLNLGQKLDYDETLWEMQKLVNERVNVSEERRRAKERKEEEKALRKRNAKLKKQREEAQRRHEEQKKQEESGSGSFDPSSFPGMDGAEDADGLGGANFEETMKNLLKDPKMQDLLNNPNFQSKMGNNPQMQEMFKKFQQGQQ